MKNIAMIFKRINTSSNPSKGEKSSLSFVDGLGVMSNPANLINRIKISVLIILFLGGFSSFAQIPVFVGSGGNGTQGNPYLISTPADLVELSNYVNLDTSMYFNYNYPLLLAQTKNTYGKYFVMTQDIDMAIVSSFYPIGSPFFKYFCGNFDGGGFTIKNLTVIRNQDVYIALFGRVSHATISNLTIDNAYINDLGLNAPFVSHSLFSNIQNCVAKNCSIAGGVQSGFIFENIGGSISNCHVINATLSGKGVYGFCYDIAATSQCENCSVINSTLIGGNSHAGGFVGHHAGLLSGCYVSNCMIFGDYISGFTSNTKCDAEIHNCYVQASLYRTCVPTYNPLTLPPWSGEFAAGFAPMLPCDLGYDDGQYYPIYSFKISNCYAACEFIMAGNDYNVAGSFGIDAVGTNINCYHLIHPQLNAFWNGSSPNAIGKSQPNLQSPTMVSYPGTANNSLNYQQPTKPWKSDCRYNPINKGYPILSWQYLPSAVVSLVATDTTATSATLHGVAVNNDDTLVEKGFQWRAVGDSVWITTTVSGITDTISALLTGLNSNTVYEFKSYITTTKTTKYGDTLRFSTLSPSIVITLEATDITQTSATFYGIIIENGEPVLERGFEWRAVGDSIWITSIVSELTDTISDQITGLTSNTLYEFKAYLTTTDTIKYGDTLHFSTLEISSTVTTLAATDITQNSATLHGLVTENDELVLERGFEWRQVGADNWTNVLATGTDTISYSLTGLMPNSHYEFTAYIRTSIVKYGEIFAFTTEDSITNIINYLSKSDRISLFPNPTTGKLTISLPTSSEGGVYEVENVEIYDIVGKVVANYQLSIVNSQLNIDVSELSNGAYFITFHIDGQRITKKMVKY